MARPPKGKPLTLRPIRLDNDVWAECQRLGKEHGTINEGLATAISALHAQQAQGRVAAVSPQPTGQFRVRCIHTGCKGSYFQSSSRYATLCAECGDKGHIGNPRNCRECANESETGAI